MKYITTKRIESWHPCPEDFAVLEKRYPMRVPLTRAVGRQLMADGVDVVWGLIHLLSKTQRTEFCRFVVIRAMKHAAEALDSARRAADARRAAADARQKERVAQFEWLCKTLRLARGEE